MEPNQNSTSRRCKRIAIIGAGSSGLIAIKHIRDELPHSEIIAFEKSDTIVGCWGRPPAGFVSTSTKFATQFACFPLFNASVKPDAGASRHEFFCDQEYGEYLEAFATEFELRKHIRLLHEVTRCERNPQDDAWMVRFVNNAGPIATEETHEFDAIVICTGLAALPNPVDLDVPSVPMDRKSTSDEFSEVRHSRVVVMGGGESAVDHACRLARAELQNEVFLSLHSGIRVSPRYHPIRGVPSDFLRNRLMLSIHENLRNWIGQRFVEARIRYESLFRSIFPDRHDRTEKESSEHCQRRKEWTWNLTKAAKDDLFNMFHNKSDDFLRLVAEQRIRIVGPPVDRSGQSFYQFQCQETLMIQPDRIVPSIGFRSTLSQLGDFHLKDFYLGCVSIRTPSLYLVGFARPIIGNIPSISEMQAKYVAGTLSGRIQDSQDIACEHASDRAYLASRFSRLNLNAIYPVEMFPYCDRLAHKIGCAPTLSKFGSLREFARYWLAPATTLHYFWDNPRAKAACTQLPIYMPWIFIALLWMLQPIDWVYRLFVRKPATKRSVDLKLVKARWGYKQWMLLGNPAYFFDRLVTDFGDFVHYRGLFEFYLVNHPSLVKQILQETHENFDKRTVIYNRFRHVFRSGLVVSEGESWRRQRKLIQPMLGPSAVKRYFVDMRASVEGMMERWQVHITRADAFDVAPDMNRLTLEIAGRALFRETFHQRADDIERWTREINHYSAKPPLPIIRSSWFPSRLNHRIKRNLAEFHQFLQGMIDQHRQDECRDGLLGVLLNARHEATGEPMRDEEVRDELLGMIVGGHETASAALTWVWYELAQNPDVERRLHQEISKVLGNDPVELHHLPQLRYVKMVVDEVLRMHPPFWFENRNVARDVTLSGTTLREGSLVVFSRYSLQRHPEFWDSPDKFCPERFDPERPENPRSTYASIPYGGGPRICVGIHFATMELIVAVSMIARRYQLEIASTDRHVMAAKLTMHPKNGLHVRLRERQL